MKIIPRGSRIPGLPATGGAQQPEPPPGEAEPEAAATTAPPRTTAEAPAAAEQGAPRAATPADDSGGAEPRTRPRRRSSRRRETSGAVPADGNYALERELNPYAGEGTVPLNARILLPLHDRYKNLARELTAIGYRTAANDLYVALLHYGPSDVDEARDLVERFRKEKSRYQGEPTRASMPRVYSSIHNHYQQLAWALQDAGVEGASMTQLLQALLHFGPNNTAAARALARRWRTLLAA